MCDPLTIAAVAATVGGTMYNSNQEAKNQARMVGARNDVTAAEMVRQKAFQEEAAASFDNTRKPFEDGKQVQAQGEKTVAREAASTASIDNAPKYEAPVSGSAPDVVGKEVARRVAGGSTAAKAQLGAESKLKGLSDLFFDNSVNLNSGRRDLGQIADFSGRSASLLPFEQTVAANNARKAPGMFGDLLKTAGMAAGMYSMMGGGPTWGSLFGGPAANSSVLAPNLVPNTPSLTMVA